MPSATFAKMALPTMLLFNAALSRAKTLTPCWRLNAITFAWPAFVPPTLLPEADSIDTPEWKKFVADYKATFKDGFPSPSLFAYLYYINTRAALEALDAVKGDLSDGQKKYRAALQKTSFKGPAGEVRIDENRNGVGTTYITEVAKAADGGVPESGAPEGGSTPHQYLYV